VATLHTQITMRSMAQVQRGPTPTSIILAISNMARDILVKDQSLVESEG
jgi:hypothetical protein